MIRKTNILKGMENIYMCSRRKRTSAPLERERRAGDVLGEKIQGNVKSGSKLRPVLVGGRGRQAWEVEYP